MTYSYTQISQYLTCPRRYRHRYLDGWQEKDSRAAMIFGRCFEQAVAALFRHEDPGAVLFEQWADPVAMQMAAFTTPGHTDWDAFERRWSRLRADESLITRAIVVDGEVVGTIGSWGDADEREVTYWIGRSYWGTGIATDVRISPGSSAVK